jgi:flagellar biosynthesis/type III secretory pathway chaperone
MDDLTQVLENETDSYKELVRLSEDLREALIGSDVPSVERLTAAQEDVSNDIQSMESRRGRIMRDMATVLNKKPEELTLGVLEETLANQPQAREELTTVRTELKMAMEELRRINHTNQTLLRQSMDLLEFDLNLFRSMRQAPETANYNKAAMNTGDLLGSRGFDAKQ